jgi:ubiquitin-like domain-containing CTD phosphatase 1
VYDFRNLIHGLTRVPPARQKLIGLSKGKLPPEADPVRFATLGIKKGCKFTMIGTPEELSFKDPKDVFLPEVSCLVTNLTTYDNEGQRLYCADASIVGVGRL